MDQKNRALGATGRMDIVIGQIEALSGASSKAVIDFTGLTDALDRKSVV